MFNCCSAELYEECTLGKCDVVPGAQLNLGVWTAWESLVAAVLSGQTNQVLSLSSSYYNIGMLNVYTILLNLITSDNHISN